MDTDTLIETLVARHRAVEPAWIERRSLLAVIAGLGVAVLAIRLTIGFRSDLADALQSGRILAKYGFILTALVMAGHLFNAMARPGGRLRRQAIAYALPLGFIAVAALGQMALNGLPSRSALLGDSGNWVACMLLVPLLSLPPLAYLMLVLRRAAPTDLAGAGFAAGVFATAIAATVYAAHCPCDTPVFVALWYPIAFAFGGLIGARLAPRLARW